MSGPAPVQTVPCRRCEQPRPINAWCVCVPDEVRRQADDVYDRRIRSGPGERTGRRESSDPET